MTADLVQFLRDRYDEETAAARGCGQPSMSWQNFNMDGELRDDVNAGTVAVVPREETRAHIARHDPARVLREVEAKRRILRAHEKWCEGRCEAKYPEGGFDAAHYWSIKALAAVYDDHPDYRPEWRP